MSETDLGAEKVASVEVKTGDLIELVVLPKQADSCRVTKLALQISRADGADESWDLTADILADATIALVTKDPSVTTGQAWIDEDVLRAEGVNDFEKYACVPGTKPMPIPW